MTFINKIQKLPYELRLIYSPLTNITTDTLNIIHKIYLRCLTEETPIIFDKEKFKKFSSTPADKDKIVFTLFYKIPQLRTYKSFNTRQRPTTILNYKDKIKFAKFNRYIYLKLDTNTLLIDLELMINDYAITQSTINEFLFALYVFKYSLTQEEKINITNFIQQTNNLTNLEVDEKISTIKKQIEEEAITQIIQQTVSKFRDTQQNYYNRQITQTQSSQAQLITKIRELQQLLDSLMFKKNNLSEFETDFSIFIKRYIREKQINDINEDFEGVSITTNYLTVDFLEYPELDKIIKQNQLNLSEQRLCALQKVADFTANLITLPITIRINIDDYSSTTPYKIRFATKYNEYHINEHALFNNGRGCFGSFATEFQLAQANGDIKRIITTSLQYLRSLTIHDVLGDRMLAYLPIIDENGIIIDFPSKQHLIGLKINDLIENFYLYNSGEEQIKKFKEEHYGSQINEQ